MSQNQGIIKFLQDHVLEDDTIEEVDVQSILILLNFTDTLTFSDRVGQIKYSPRTNLFNNDDNGYIFKGGFYGFSTY